MIENNILYYISQIEEDPELRLFVPKRLRKDVLKQYHELNGHMSLGNTFNTIKQKYYWINLYQELNEHIRACVTCKLRNLKQQRDEIQLTSTPAFPFAALQLDLSGPYPMTLSGNLYLCSFIDIYSGWLESFPIPDKTTESIIQILLDEIITRHSCVLSITTDNGREFDNKLFKETLDYLNIQHIKTSFYHPEGNSKVERSHRTLHDILSKKMKNNNTWDLELNSVLMAIRMNVSKTTGKSPFSLLYCRDPILPLDNILRPRRKYQGEDFHEIALENQHKAFLRVIKTTQNAKVRRNEYANKNKTKKESFSIGDSVYYKNHKKEGKLDKNWLTHHVIVKKTSPVSYVIRNQLTGRLIKAHSNSLRLAQLEWKLPKEQKESLRRTVLVESPPEVSQTESSESSDDETKIYEPEELFKESISQTINDDNEEFDADDELLELEQNETENKQPNEFLIKNKRKILERNEDSENTPLFEARKRARIEFKESDEESMNEEISDISEIEMEASVNEIKTNKITKENKKGRNKLKGLFYEIIDKFKGVNPGEIIDV